MIGVNELRPGLRLEGLHPTGIAEIVGVRPVGPKALITYVDEYGVNHSLVVGETDLDGVRPISSGEGRLDGDPVQFALGIDALRIKNAHLLNPLLALTTANVEPLPHQVQAVYEHLLVGESDRFLLADDPGAGKTVMAGLYIREALARGWVNTVAVIAPGSLVEQWQDELLTKFGLNFELFTSAVGDGNPFDQTPFVIARLDQLSRNVRLREQLAEAAYDLVVMDEAHKLSARFWGSKLVKSKRYELGEIVRDSARRVLLMTATPHNGKDEEFALFLRLLGVQGRGEDPSELLDAGLMRRLVKEQLVHADGSPLFPARHAATVTYRMSALELDLYEAVTEYVRHEMNKMDGEERRTVGFALLVLQRRVASSPEAILRSLHRRTDRLAAELQRVQAADDRLLARLEASISGPQDADEWTATEEAEWEEEASAVATTARTPAELQTEIMVLTELLEKATRVREADVDAKWEALAELLQSPEMFESESGARRKILIFTEHKDTLEYLEDKLNDLVNGQYDIETIHGGCSRDERRGAQIRFRESDRSAILVATDAAGEGVNLQVAHLMVNYDIPWNPNRLEQRFGRIHRIGQRHECHLWNLVAAETREGDVFLTLMQKLERQRNALGDAVFDVLGEVLHESNLRDLLVSALNGAAPEDVERELASVDRGVADAIERRRVAQSSLTAEDVAGLRQRMALARAGSLNPTVVREFVISALVTLQGEIVRGSAGWTVRHVPERVRRVSSAIQTRYGDVEFEPVTDAAGLYGPRELLAPGHPLVTALAEVVLGDAGVALRQGVILDDDRSEASYAVVVARRRSDGMDRLVVLRWVSSPDAAGTPVDLGLLSALLPSQAPANQAELALIESVLAAMRARGDEALAVAYVRGAALAETAEGWDNARDVLIQGSRGAVVTESVGCPWDVQIEDDGVWKFVKAVPTGLVRLRAHEVAAQQALGDDYSICEF
ncbi:DEAD/DEAH box helicase [Nocardioides humilatus]|uniref:DEAD/DEAH box helicase n=1 Tax=Nocardioides humilatus TaxID=2607660 RepID=UPI00165F5F2A|nr:helicase-related protein [Nocardioides humilatus]